MSITSERHPVRVRHPSKTTDFCFERAMTTARHELCAPSAEEGICAIACNAISYRRGAEYDISLDFQNRIFLARGGQNMGTARIGVFDEYRTRAVALSLVEGLFSSDMQTFLRNQLRDMPNSFETVGYEIVLLRSGYVLSSFAAGNSLSQDGPEGALRVLMPRQKARHSELSDLSEMQKAIDLLPASHQGAGPERLPVRLMPAA